jgi:GTP-binding protein
MRHLRPRPAARHRAPTAEERSLTDPKFIGSFPRADTQLDPPLPEIAFLGRSNVGKSSLLNALVGRRIAKTSGTPGKTRALNVFLVPGAGSQESGIPESRLLAPGSHYFLDLPGYGYARAGKSERTAFRGLLKHTLRRERLAGVVWLLDIRHHPSVDDRAMQDVLVGGETHVLAALTKSDKLSTNQRRARELELRDELELPEDQMVVTSAKTGEGIVDLRDAIAGLIGATK